MITDPINLLARQIADRELEALGDHLIIPQLDALIRESMAARGWVVYRPNPELEAEVSDLRAQLQQAEQAMHTEFRLRAMDAANHLDELADLRAQIASLHKAIEEIIERYRVPADSPNNRLKAALSALEGAARVPPPQEAK